MKIRLIEKEDAKKYLIMLKQLDRETKYMLYEAGERTIDESDLKQRIIRTIESESLLLIAEENDKILGFLSADRGFANRIKHSVYIVTGILKESHGKGIGRAFLKKWISGQKIKE